MSLRAVLAAADEVLGGVSSPWCVVGGLAVAVRTTARFTVDVDLVVPVVDDRAGEAVTRAFLRSGFALVAAREHEATGRLAAVRLERGPGEELDLLFALTGIEAVIVKAAEPVEILPERVARTATLGHLVAMKLLSVDDARPRDEQDLVALFRRCDEVERRRVVAALAAIEAEGCHRGRDLLGLLAVWEARSRG